MKHYYVYDLIDPRTSQPFYVGKGQKDRIYSHVAAVLNGQRDDNVGKCNKIREIMNEGFEVEHKFIDWFDTDKEAKQFERNRIAQIGRIDKGTGPLFNRKSGDEKPPTSERRVKQCDYCTGKVIKIHKSTNEAARNMGIIWESSLANAVRGRSVSYLGFIWCYADEEPRLPTTLIYQWNLTGKLITIHKNEGDASRSIRCAQAQLHACIDSGRPCKGVIVSRTSQFPGITPKKKLVQNFDHRKPVVHLNTQTTYPSVTVAANATGHNVGSVSACCQGKMDGIGRSGRHANLDYFKYLDQQM